MNWPNFSSDNISVNFEAIAKAECVFPFNYEGKSYNACTQDGAANYEFWCATSVTDSLLDIYLIWSLWHGMGLLHRTMSN
jgi:hypothetical protein